MKIISFSLIMMMLVSSCSIAPTNIGEIENSIMVSDQNTPYAEESELELISASQENIHHKVARIFVLEEMTTDREFLSKKPVIIYDLKGDPMYYEYRVVKDGIAYGSYAVPVQKNKGVGVTISQEQANDYSVTSNNMIVVAPFYPSRVGLVEKIKSSHIS